MRKESDNREEEEHEEEAIENRERVSSRLNHLHFCICAGWGRSGSADFLLPAEATGRARFYPESFARTQAGERQEAWPGFDNERGRLFLKKPSAGQRKRCLFCFLLVVLSDVQMQCVFEQLNVALCVRMNSLCSESNMDAKTSPE